MNRELYIKQIKNIAFYAILFFIAVFSAACTNQTDQPPSTNTFHIVTSFYPVYVLTANIANGAENVSITNMAAPQTGCLHDYQLTTGNLKEIGAASIFIINGANMESFLDKAFSLYPNLPVIDSSIGTIQIPLNDGHQHGAEEEAHNHDEEGNSHIWLSPSNALIQAENIKNGLIQANPENAVVYEQNYLLFQENCQLFIKKYDSLNASGKKTGIFHEGFGYFAEICSLDIELSIFADENQMPSARALSEAVNKIKAENITILLAADDEGLQFAEVLSKETDIPYYLLDPVTTGDFSLDSYFTAMESNYKILQEALR